MGASSSTAEEAEEETETLDQPTKEFGFAVSASTDQPVETTPRAVAVAAAATAAVPQLALRSSVGHEGLMGRQPGSSDEQRAREDFTRFWQQYVPGGSRTSTVSRPLMREVLLRAVRELALTPRQGSQAEDLVAGALGTAPPALAAEDAFNVFRSVMQSLRSSHLPQSGDNFQQALHRDFASTFPHPVASNYAKMPKGARTVDPVPMRRLPGGPFAHDASVANGNNGDPTRPSSSSARMRAADCVPTRAAQESAHASLRAAVGASQASYEKLLIQAESLRESLVLGRFDGDLSRDLLSSDHGRSLAQTQAVKLEAEVDQQLDRLRAHASVIEQQQMEMAALHEDCMLQAQRAQAALRRLNETKEKLEDAQQESSELARQAKTEQLRAVMLREAFEQEQNRVGVSLGQAEAYVSDLVAATEGTRRIEVEEQSVARECIAQLNEIHSAQAREELAAEAKLAQLVRELQAAKAALTAAEAAPAAGRRPQDTGAHSAKTEVERNAVLTELVELRRRSHGVAAIAKRRAADAQIYQRELQALRQRSDHVRRELQATQDGLAGTGGPPRSSSIAANSSGSLQARLHLEEAAEAGLQVAEARLEGEMADAQIGIFTEEPSLAGARHQRLMDQAGRYARDLEKELEQVRSELSAASAMVSRSIDGAWRPDPGSVSDDLVAAGLQRRVGMALAAERESLCRLGEERFRQRLAAEELSNLRRRLDGVTVGESQKPPIGTADVSRLSRTPEQPESPGLSAAVAAADVHSAPSIAASQLQARLAALRGQLTEGPDDQSIGSRFGGDRISAAEENRSIHSQLKALREQINGKA